MNDLMRVASSWLLLAAMDAEAACVSPIADPAQAGRSAWDDLLGMQPAADLNPSTSRVQRYSDDGDGPLSLDYYSLTFDSGGRKPIQWMNDFRANIDKRIFTGTAFAVKPLDAANAERWSSSSPVGALLVFDLSPPPERGAVVVSCKTAASFAISTVRIEADPGIGDHPVSGHRGFAFIANDDGSITFFSKGIGRRKSNNEGFAKLGSERIFDNAEATWKRMLGNLRDANARRNPRAEVSHRRSEEF